MKEKYDLGKAPNIIVTDCAADVVVKGGQAADVTVSGQHEAQPGDGRIELRGSGSLALIVPLHTALVMQNVSGDAIIKGVDGPLRLERVNGDAVLKSVGEVHAETVHGDLVAQNVGGDLNLETVMGDVALRNVGDLTIGLVHGDLAVRFVEGDVSVADVAGDILLHTVNGDTIIRRGQRDANLSNLGGQLTVKSVNGDIRLTGGLAAGKHHCAAQGDIVVRWPVDAPLNLLVSRGQVHNCLDLQDVVEKDGGFRGRIGDGETTLVLEADGRVILKEMEETGWHVDVDAEFGGLGAELAGMGIELSGLGQQISGEINARMSELSARMEERFGQDFVTAMADKAAKRTERAVRRAMRQAEKVHTRTNTMTWSPPQPSKKESRVSAQEQEKILRMLEKGIISVEEAETLLKALEE